ncbi:putative P450 monooxygenase [Aspergillus spinulosporus]
MSSLSHVFSTGLHSLNASTILLTLVTVIILQFLCQIIYYKFFHPLRHYPGPFWASVTRLWSAWHYFRGTETELLWQAVKKYGPVVRVSPTMLLIADSTLIPTIYHRRSTKARWFPEELFKRPGILLVRDPFKHAAHRRLVSNTYSLSNIQKMEGLIERNIIRWLNKLNTTYAERVQPMDFAVWSAFLSYDTITDVGFRKPLGFVESGKDVDNLIHIFHAGTVWLGAVARVYQLFDLLTHPLLKKYFQVSPEQSLWFGGIMKRSNQVLTDRAKALQEGRIVKPEKGDDDYDFLQAFMDTRTPEGNFLDAETIQSEIFVILSAGTDGFGSSASALFAEVLSRPAIYARVLKEIKTAVQTGQISYPIPTYTEVVKSLPFYNACIRESMRLQPSASTLLSREITPLDPEIVIQGRKIPVGVELTANPWISHRDKAVYGEDAEEFNPDRWLDDPIKAKELEKYNLAFGAGSRVCLGKHFAMAMLYKAPVALFMKFDVSLCKETPQTPKLSSKMNGAVRIWENIWLNLKTREPWVAVRENEQAQTVQPPAAEA